MRPYRIAYETEKRSARQNNADSVLKKRLLDQSNLKFHVELSKKLDFSLEFPILDQSKLKFHVELSKKRKKGTFLISIG